MLVKFVRRPCRVSDDSRTVFGMGRWKITTAIANLKVQGTILSANGNLQGKPHDGSGVDDKRVKQTVPTVSTIRIIPALR